MTATLKIRALTSPPAAPAERHRVEGGGGSGPFAAAATIAGRLAVGSGNGGRRRRQPPPQIAERTQVIVMSSSLRAEEYLSPPPLAEDDQRLNVYRHLVRAGDLLEVAPVIRLSAVTPPPPWIPDAALRHLTVLFPWDVWQRGAVTLTCLALYVALGRVPLPWVDHAVANTAAGAAGALPRRGLTGEVGAFVLGRVGVGPAVSASIVLGLVTAEVLPLWIRDHPLWRQAGQGSWRPSRSMQSRDQVSYLFPPNLFPLITS